MAWYDVVLYVHILTVAAAFFAIGIAVYATVRCCQAVALGDARDAITCAARVGRFMPVITVVLLATGGFLTQSRWTWTSPWIDVSIAGLLLITAVGAGIIASRERALHRKFDALRDGDAALPRDPMLLHATGINIGLAAAVMFVMVVKPELTASIAALVVGACCGYLTMSSLARSTGPVPAPAK